MVDELTVVVGTDKAVDVVLDEVDAVVEELVGGATVVVAELGAGVVVEAVMQGGHRVWNIGGDNTFPNKRTITPTASTPAKNAKGISSSETGIASSMFYKQCLTNA